VLFNVCLNQERLDLSHTKACHPINSPACCNHEDSTRGNENTNAHIAARRQREMMVILRDHLNGETAEWLGLHYIDDVETDHDEVQQQQSATSTAVNIIGNIHEWTDTPCNGKT